jgi:hypothetical protein
MAYMRAPPKHWNIYRPSYSARRSSSSALRHQATNDRRGQDSYGKEDYDSQLCDAELESLMSRTARAYDLVINYERDSYGGQRWSSSDIAHIYNTGKELHGKIRLFKSWRRSRATSLNLAQVDGKVEEMRKLCETVQRAIKETENVAAVQILPSPQKRRAPNTRSSNTRQYSKYTHNVQHGN